MWERSRTKRLDREYRVCREVEEGTGRPGFRSKFWVHVDRDEEKEGIGGLRGRSKSWASEDRRDELCVTREAVRDDSHLILGDQRDGFGKIREGQRDGLSSIRRSSRRRTRSEIEAKDMQTT